jgi:hypothetical protein
VVLGHADVDKSAVAVSVPLIFRNIGASIGVTVALVVVSSGGRTGPFLAEDGFGRGFGLGAAAAGLLVAAGLLLPGRRRSSGQRRRAYDAAGLRRRAGAAETPCRFPWVRARRSQGGGCGREGPREAAGGS